MFAFIIKLGFIPLLRMALVWMQPLLLRRYLGVIFVVTRASRRSLSDLRGRRMNDTRGFCAKLIPTSDYIQTIFF